METLKKDKDQKLAVGYGPLIHRIVSISMIRKPGGWR